MDKKIVFDNKVYNLLTDQELEDLKTAAVIVEKEKMRKEGKLKFYSSDEAKKMIFGE